MTPPRYTVVEVACAIVQDGQTSHASVAGAFDEVRTQDQARAVGRQVGELLAEVLARRLQAGERLAA